MPYSHPVPSIWSAKRVRASRSRRSSSTASSTRTSYGSILLCSGNRRELQVQLVEAAQHVDRRVVVAPLARGTVLRLRHADVGGAVEDALEADLALGSRQRCARAGVDAEPEADVVPPVDAIQAQVGGALELP